MCIHQTVQYRTCIHALFHITVITNILRIANHAAKTCGEIDIMTHYTCMSATCTYCKCRNEVHPTDCVYTSGHGLGLF